MSVFAGPGVVTSGLIFYVDAGDPKSYPGSGTSWFDLSGNGYTQTLNNAPAYDSRNGGVITFDRTNNNKSATTTGAPVPAVTAYTLSVWINHIALPPGTGRYLSLLGAAEYGVIRDQGGAGQLHFYYTTSGTLKLGYTVNGELVANQWYNIVGTFNGTTATLYKNCVVMGSPQTPGGVLDTGPFNIYLSMSTEAMGGYMAAAKVYNRALSAAEISQNFNALRGRFGI